MTGKSRRKATAGGGTKNSFRMVAFCLVVLLASAGAEARVTQFVIDSRKSPAFAGASFGAAGAYETLTGRAFGELDPKDPHNSIIQDIELAPRNAHGMVEYTASFQIVKPVDMCKSSHLMWHDVPNRGGRITIVPEERALGDIGLSSGWQGDNSGATAVGPAHEYVVVPVAHNADGSPVTGPVMARIFNASGPASQPFSFTAIRCPIARRHSTPAKPALTTHASESIDGKIGKPITIAASDWAWAKCSADNPFPGTPDPTQICLQPRLRSRLAVSSRFHRQRPSGTGHRLCRLPRCRFLFSLCRQG